MIKFQSSNDVDDYLNIPMLQKIKMRHEMQKVSLNILSEVRNYDKELIDP
jgi:hypothetical protein